LLGDNVQEYTESIFHWPVCKNTCIEIHVVQAGWLYEFLILTTEWY
jgi:hypothetical protein